jgi:pilus assembly protein Flp/PilA
VSHPSLQELQLTRADLGAGNGIGNPEEASTMKLVQFVKNFVREEDAVTAIEYGLIASLIAVVIIGSVTLVGDKLDVMFEYISNQIKTSTA